MNFELSEKWEPKMFNKNRGIAIARQKWLDANFVGSTYRRFFITRQINNHEQFLQGEENI